MNGSYVQQRAHLLAKDARCGHDFVHDGPGRAGRRQRRRRWNGRRRRPLHSDAALVRLAIGAPGRDDARTHAPWIWILLLLLLPVFRPPPARRRRLGGRGGQRALHTDGQLRMRTVRTGATVPVQSRYVHTLDWSATVQSTSDGGCLYLRNHQPGVVCRL
jgi:hypothetical protein